LRRIRIHPDLVAKEHYAEGLLRDLLVRGRMRRVLFFGAELARHLVPNHLRAEGVEVDVVAAYRTRRLGAEQAVSLTEALSNRQLNAVHVTSSSIATALFEALGTNAHSLLRDVAIASIGPVTSATLERLGAAVSVTSRVFTISALLDALEPYYAALVDGDEHRQPTT
jgi:uroporphyrinogen-III synthase